MKQFFITEKDAGQRFDKYLKKLLPEAPFGFLYKMLRKKNITLNGKKAEGGELLKEQDTISVFFSEETFQKFSGQAVPDKEYLTAFRELGKLSILYEDKDILILDKPVGILSQKAEKTDMSANEWLIGYMLEQGEITGEELKSFRPSVCNRLDRNTGGVLLCGKTLRGSRFLSAVLRDRRLHKYYLAYVQGRITEKRKLIGYLRKDENKNRAVVLSQKKFQELVSRFPEREKEYKKIETVIEPLDYLEDIDCTRLEVLLITGKSHQIRAQLSAIGHPVAGDVKYGWKADKKKEALLRSWEGAAEPAPSHQFLYACRVEFPEIEGEFSYLSGKVFKAIQV